MAAKRAGPVQSTIAGHTLTAHACDLARLEAAAFGGHTASLNPALQAAIVKAAQAGACFESALHLQPYSRGASTALEVTAAYLLSAAYREASALAPRGES